MRLGFVGNQAFHLRELVDRLLDFARLLVLDAKVEVGVRQGPVDPLRAGDLVHARLALAGPQEGQSVIQAFPRRTRVQVQRFL